MLLLIFYLLNINYGGLAQRGMWIRGISIASPDSIPKILYLAEQLKITDLYVQVVVGGYAYYKSEILPRSEYLAKYAPLEYDPLDSLIKLAKIRNLRIHAWINTFLIWSMDSLPDSSRHVNYAHPDWFLKDVYGRSMFNYAPIERQNFGLEGTFLDPEIGEVRAYLKSICTEVVTKYAVDGIHLDFIRYPGVFWGVKDTLLCALLAGLNNRDLRWLTLLRYPQLNFFNRFIIYNFYLANKERQRNIKETLYEIYSAVKRIDRKRILSCAFVSSPSRASYQYAQDWWNWKGVIDYPVVMSYTPDINLFKDFLNFSMYHMPGSIMGIGFLWKGMEMQANTEVDYVRKNGGRGICFFDFASLDTMADLNILTNSSLVLSDTTTGTNNSIKTLDSLFFELPKTEWVYAGMNYIKYGEDLEFAKFLFSLSLNPEQDFAKMGLRREDFMNYIKSDVAGFEHLKRKLLLPDKRLLEPPSREIEYTFLKWKNSDSSAVRMHAKKLKKYDFKRIIYPDAMHPLARAVFNAEKGEKKIVETRAGLYIFCVKKIREGGRWIKKDKIRAEAMPLYIYWTIKEKFDELYYGK